jgi:hypothetical protein
MNRLTEAALVPIVELQVVAPFPQRSRWRA